MVQRTVVFGVVVAALLGAAPARAQEGKATVVLRDGRKIEAARVEFRERTFVVRTADGEEERLDERDVLRIELGTRAGGADRASAVHPPLRGLTASGAERDDGRVRILFWTVEGAVGVDLTSEVERRQRPDGAWGRLTVLRGTAKQGGGSVLDEDASWPRRYDYRVTTTAVAQEGFTLAEADVRRVATLEDVEGPRRLWVSPAAIGSELVVDVRRGQRSSLVRAVVGQPLVVDGVPVGARVTSIGSEADGAPTLRVAWDGLAEPELVRADAAFGDPQQASVFVGAMAAAPARPAPRVAIDLRQATLAATARTLGVEAGGAFSLAQVDPATRVDLRLRATTFDQAGPLVAELLGRKLVPCAGVTAISAPELVAERYAPATSPLVRRLDEERVTLLVSAPRAYDLSAALDRFAAATGIDVVLSTAARQAAASVKAGFVHAPSVTLAQALTLLSGAAGMTWTTRGEVVLVKTHGELALDEVWLDLHTPEGTTLEALAPALRASGIELWAGEGRLAHFAQPALAGRVALSSLLAGLVLDSRGVQKGVWQWIQVKAPERLPGVTDLFVRSDGQVDAHRPGSMEQGIPIKNLVSERGRVRLWGTDPGPALEALRCGQATVVAVNGRPPPPPPTPAAVATEPAPPAPPTPDGE